MFVINLLAGPGAGKSTIAAHVYAELKWEGVNCELVTEFAKDAAWEEHFRLYEHQVLLFGEQYRRLKRLEGQVDVAVTDAPLLLQLIYMQDGLPPSFAPMVLEAHRQFDNMNFLVRRVKEYRKVGRHNEEEEARQLDAHIEEVLQENTLRYKSLPGVRASVPYIVQKILQKLGVRR